MKTQNPEQQPLMNEILEHIVKTYGFKDRRDKSINGREQRRWCGENIKHGIMPVRKQ